MSQWAEVIVSFYPHTQNPEGIVTALLKSKGYENVIDCKYTVTLEKPDNGHPMVSFHVNDGDPFEIWDICNQLVNNPNNLVCAVDVRRIFFNVFEINIQNKNFHRNPKGSGNNEGW